MEAEWGRACGLFWKKPDLGKSGAWLGFRGCWCRFLVPSGGQVMEDIRLRLPHAPAGKGAAHLCPPSFLFLQAQHGGTGAGGGWAQRSHSAPGPVLCVAPDPLSEPQTPPSADRDC